MNAFKVSVNNLFKKNFDIIFIKNKKNVKIYIFFSLTFFVNNLYTSALFPKSESNCINRPKAYWIQMVIPQ